MNLIGNLFLVLFLQLFLSLSGYSENFQTNIMRLPAACIDGPDCADTPAYKQKISADLEDYRTLGPDKYLSQILDNYFEQTKEFSDEAPLALTNPRDLKIKALRNPLTKLLYSEGILEASDRSLLLCDKLFASKVMEHYLGNKEFKNYHLKTEGLKSFLTKFKIVDSNGLVIKSKMEIMAILEMEFPKGFLVKPAVGMKSSGKNFYLDKHEVVELILKQNGDIYQPEEYKTPHHWERVRRFATGERFVFQELLPGSLGEGESDYGDLHEYRVHSFYDKVVDGATETRWRGAKNSEEQNIKVNKYVQSFLDKLPKELTNRQAWSFDVFDLPNGQMKIIEINTNRGDKGNWSGYLVAPKTLGAYVRHLEQKFGWNFQGFSGWRLRHNLANIRKNWEVDKWEYWEELKEWYQEKIVKKIFKRKIEIETTHQALLQDKGLIAYSAEEYFDKTHAPRVGMEVEIRGLSQEEISQILINKLGGRLEKRADNIKYVDKTDGNKEKISEAILYKVKGKLIDRIDVKAEGNGIDPSDYENSRKNPVLVEVITHGPLTYEQLEVFSEAIDDIKKAGASGTDHNTAVSIQANVELVDENIQKDPGKFLLNLLRNYYKDDHYKLLEQEFPLIAGRDVYVGEYSPGFMRKIRSTDYNPTTKELFDDFFYRQSAEYLGFDNAWSGTIDEVKDIIKKALTVDEFGKILRVMKYNDLRISSFLIYLFPEDWMSQFIVSTNWVKPRPLVEFRRPNNTFKVLEIAAGAMGLVQKSIEGEFNIYDDIGTSHGIRGQDAKNLLTKQNPYEKTYVVRQFLGDPSDKGEFESFKEVEHYYKKSTPVWVNSGIQDKEPLFLPGESVVFHRLPETSGNIMGKYNPVLINAEISKILEHKYVEPAFWNKYAEGSIAKTRLISDFTKEKIPVAKLKAMLDQAFPKGWVIKGVWDNATQAKFLITDKTDLEGELNKFKNNQEEYLTLVEKIREKYKNANPDVITRKLRERPEYIGHRIHQFLKKPHQSIVQEKLAIKDEYRVEVIAGHVLGNGSTIPRYQYEYPKDDAWLKDPNIQRVEEFAQSTVDRLPENLRGMTLGMDVAVLSDGSIKMIESNPQGNSGFLSNDKRSIKALDKFLKKFPEMVKNNEISLGMKTEEQLNWAHEFIEKELGLDFNLHYPHLNWGDKNIINIKRKTNSCYTDILPLLSIH